MVVWVWSGGRGVREVEDSRTTLGFRDLRNYVPGDAIC